MDRTAFAKKSLYILLVRRGNKPENLIRHNFNNGRRLAELRVPRIVKKEKWTVRENENYEPILN